MKGIVVIVSMSLMLLVGCKTNKGIDTDQGIKVTLLLEENVDINTLTKGTPFTLLNYKKVDKTRPKYEAYYDIGERLKGELTSYLVTKSGVVSVDGNRAAHTPPIKQRKVRDM